MSRSARPLVQGNYQGSFLLARNACAQILCSIKYNSLPCGSACGVTDRICYFRLPSSHRRHLARSVHPPPHRRKHSRKSEGRAIARANGKLTAIRELLDRDHVCLEIVRYLLGNGEAADTARGIAEWWINRDVSQTAEALSRLQVLGVVRSYLVQDATSVYGLTKNPLLRDTLRQCVDKLSNPTSTEVR